MPTLEWIGKQAVVNHHREVPTRLLHCDSSLSFGDPEAGNLLVEGDNLEALKALLPYYAGQVKCVFIDPPYNTGAEKWVYNDNVNSPEIRAWLGKVVGPEADDLSRHDKWLCMFYPRLRLLRDFMSDDGAIFICCDDNEVDNLRKVCDEIFGRRSYLCTIVWQSKDTPGNNSSGIAEMHNYVVVYKKGEKYQAPLLRRTDDQIENYSNPDRDSRGDWLGSPLTRAEHRDRDFYPLTNKAGRQIWPPPGSSWRRPPKTMVRLQAEDRIWWGKDGDGAFPLEKKFLKEAKEGVVQRTWWTYEYAGSTRNASAELKDVFGGKKPFDTPKPKKLVKRVLEMFDDDQLVVMDAFAGSGTTGHATLELNLEDGGSRRFLLVEMDPAVAREVTAKRLANVVGGYEATRTQSHVLAEVNLSLRNLRRIPALLDEFEAEKAARESEFSELRILVDDDRLVLRGERSVAHKAEGLGSGFRYCTLGKPIFDEWGAVNEGVTFSDLAAFVFFSDTGSPIPTKASGDTPLLGTFDGRAIYLLFSVENAGVAYEAAGNVLTPDALAALPPPEPSFAGPRTVYAEGCTVPAERLAAAGVSFKQIPYQLQAA